MEKPESEIVAEVQAIIRQITASVTFLPLLDESCAADAFRPLLFVKRSHFIYLCLHLLTAWVRSLGKCVHAVAAAHLEQLVTSISAYRRHV